MDKYFQSTQTGLCTACHTSCATCTNATECATCDTATKLYQMNSSNLCSCPSTQYYNSGQGKCTTCSTTCKTCLPTSGTSCTSCDTGRSLVSTACPCLPYHYDNSAICSPCHYSCKTCSGSLVTQCLTCSSTNYRDTTLSGGKCLCSSGYYDDGVNMLCKKCSYQCKTCSDALTCDACDAALFRETPGGLCPCKAGYYETAALTCAKCAYYCVTCQQADICLTCDSPNRSLDPVSLKCQCPDTFFDDGSNIACQSCLSECKTCTSSTECVSCQVADYRELSADNLCPCIDKYFDDSGTCTACEYYCKTCTEAVTCDTCNSTANRVLDTPSNKCICKDGFYDTGNEECEPCHYTCTQCQTSATHCTSCDSTRSLDASNQCACKDSYFDNSVATCPSCQYTCKTCTNSTACSGCNPLKYRTFDNLNVRCLCIDKYYDDGTSELCKACSYKCRTCTNATQCLTCDATKFRNTPASMCPCTTKFYDSGTSSQTCLACQYSCSTCTKGTECLTCDLASNHRTLDSSTKLCKCLDKFYDDGTNEQCLSCVYSCATCQTSSSHCLSCSDSTTHRELVNNACPCKIRFFDENLDNVCESCQYTCKTCSDATTCDTCDSTKHRQHNTTDDLCHCATGYFDNSTNSETCQQCHASCVSCADSSSCLTCDSSKKRLLNSSATYNGSVSQYCVCEYGYYSSSSGSTCLACHYSCEVCSGGDSDNCLYCDSGAHRSLSSSTKKCLCLAGYYQDGSNQLCPQCHSFCQTCTGPSNTQCPTCKSTAFSLSNQTSCFDTCPDYYFNNVDGMKCTLCDDNCLHCSDQTTCTQCEGGYHLHAADHKCYQDCPDGYWENTTFKVCSVCPFACLTCESAIQCNDCIDHYYFDLSLELCFSCHETCKSCAGSAQDQCLTCYQPLYWKTNKCHNLTCPYGQYVDSVLGCKNCADLFINSLTCNKTEAFLCTATFKLKDGECKVCSDVQGYHITSSTNTCSEICGDGKLYDYQCDDGNQLDGDGCSKSCMIEQGWNCRVTSTGLTSVCSLQSALSMTLNKLIKASGKNSVTIYFSLSLPYRLISDFSVTAEGVSPSELSWSHLQNEANLSSVQLKIDYTKTLQGKSFQISYDSSSARRLLLAQHMNNSISDFSVWVHTKRLMVQSSIAFNTQLEIATFPPVEYYSSEEFKFFDTAKSIIYYLALVLLILSLIVFPNKTHLHSFTFSFIVAKVWLIFGLGLQEKMDWVNHVFHDFKGFAMIGGISMGRCCHTISSFYGYSSQFVSNSLYVLIAWAAMWLFLVIINFINKFISKSQSLVQYVNYFAVTVHLTLNFHIFYSSLNALYHYSIQSPQDSFNTTISLVISIFCLFLIITMWILSFSLKKKHKTAMKIIDTNNITGRTEKENVFQKNSTSEELNDSKYQTFEPSSRISGINQQHNQNQSDFKPISHRKRGKQLKTYSNQDQSYLFKQERKMSQNTLLFWDYRTLYHPQRKSALYFLPFTLTVLYVQALMIVFLAPYDKFYFIVVEGSIEIIYLFYMILQRPFASKFTNFRICLISVLFLAMQGITIYYLYLQRKAQYFGLGEDILICLSGLIFILEIVFCILEHIFSWKAEISQSLQKCLTAFETQKHELKVYDAPVLAIQKQSQDEINFETIQQTPAESQVLDAFYARVLKKDSIMKKFRRQRKMKEGIYRPY